MVDSAPAPDQALAQLAERMRGRVLVAHNAPFDRRVLAQAFERAGMDWPDPPVLCTVALARKCAPLVRQRKLALLADSLGIEVDAVHRALPDATTCARILCALLPRLCACAATVADAVGALRSARRRAGPKPAAARRAPADRPDLKHLPDDPGVYVFRDERGRPLYVGKSVSLRTRARAHFCAPAGWTERAEIVDYRATNSELGALVLENRLIKQWRPAGNTALKRTDRWAYVLCRLDIEYPVLEVSSQPATGHAVSIGPVRGKKLAGELADHLTSLYRLRHCGRRMAPPRAPVDLRPDGPLLLSLPGRPRPQRLPAPGRRGAGPLRRTPRRGRHAAGRDRRAVGRGLGRASLRARRRPAAQARAAGLAALPPGRGAARGALRPQAGGGPSPGQGPFRRPLDGPRPGGRLGPASR
ncbi:MAG: exonuclease domain-containing protein [Thermoleophilaceae bacterium]